MNRAEPATAALASGSCDTGSGRSAWYASALSIIIILGILGVAQLLFVRTQTVQEIFYLGYFIPIAIAATRLSWRSAVEVSMLSTIVYLTAAAPEMFPSSQEASGIAIAAAGHAVLFVAVGLGLSTYRYRSGREREASL